MSEILETKKIGIIDGFDIVAHLEHDPDTSIDDFEVYQDDEAIQAAWKADKFHFVGTVITASREGIELGRAAIWGQEYGYWPGIEGFHSPLDADGEHLAHGYGPQLIDEAIDEAKVTLVKLWRGGDRVSTVDRDYGIDLSSNGGEWLGTFGVLVAAAVADITIEGEYGPVEVTLWDDRVYTGVLSPLFRNGGAKDAFNVGPIVIEPGDVARFRA